ncbi:MAG: sugar porter family MFS transporter [Limisphaerales bacterium]
MISPSTTAQARPAVFRFQNEVLVLVALVAILGGFLFGYDTAVINGANAFLTAHFGLNALKQGLAGASAIIGCIPGAMVAGFFSDRFGRRKMLFACAILYAVSAVLSAVPSTFGEFLAARILSGLAIGVSSMICPVYVAELAPPLWRGRLGSLFQLGIVSGIFITLFINARIQGLGDTAWDAATGWRWMLGAEVVPALIFLVILVPARESPRWLIQVNREDAARRTLDKMGGPAYANEEIEAVRNVLKGEKGNFIELLSRARFRRPLIIAVLLMAASQFSGINAIMYYSTNIFIQAGVGVKDSFAASVDIGLINLLFTFVAIALVDKAGRRPLLLVGLAAQVAALGCSAWMFHAHAHGAGLLLAIIAFIAAFAMALGPVPWILCSEIFPMRIRGRAMSVATFTIWASCLVVVLTSPMLNDNPRLGPALTFSMYAICSALAFVFVLAMVPETRGRTLEEIEMSLGKD